nr:unnamed protein product [Callosobruchus chinensis]
MESVKLVKQLARRIATSGSLEANTKRNVEGNITTSTTAEIEKDQDEKSFLCNTDESRILLVMCLRDSGNWQVGGEVVGHARIARLAEEALPISAYRVVEANHLSRLDKSFTLTIPNIEMWKRGEIQFPEEALVCYTDGSRLASGQASGAGMYVENRGVRESYSLGTNTTIFEAEVYAILSAACNEEVKVAIREIDPSATKRKYSPMLRRLVPLRCRGCRRLDIGLAATPATDAMLASKL